MAQAQVSSRSFTCDNRAEMAAAAAATAGEYESVPALINKSSSSSSVNNCDIGNDNLSTTNGTEHKVKVNGVTSSRGGGGFNCDTITVKVGRRLPSNKTFAVDIGGTLAKLVYVERRHEVQCKASSMSRRSVAESLSPTMDSTAADIEDDVTKLQLVTFDAENIDELLDYITDRVLPVGWHCARTTSGGLKQNGAVTTTSSCCRMGRLGNVAESEMSNTCKLCASATGVGCFRHHDELTKSFDGIDFQVDPREMDHCVAGITFLWRYLPPEQLLYVDNSDIAGITFQTELTASGALPCLVVNMGSALTIVQVNEDGTVSGIVGGSTQGGMTFLGLGRLLTKAASFKELIEMASRGQCQAVDLTVKDVAGSDYNSTSSDVVVSSFGKVAKTYTHNFDAEFKPDDLAASLLYCIVDEMAKTVYLVAKAQNVHRALFCGSFFSGNSSVMLHVRRKISVCEHYLQSGRRGDVGHLTSFDF